MSRKCSIQSSTFPVHLRSTTISMAHTWNRLILPQETRLPGVGRLLLQVLDCEETPQLYYRSHCERTQYHFQWIWHTIHHPVRQWSLLLLTTIQDIPPRPTSYTSYQLSTLPSIQWYGGKYGKGLQEFDWKSNPVRQTMAFLHSGIQNYTTIEHNSKSSRNTVWKVIQIQPFYLALTAHQQQNCIYPWGNCQEGKQTPWKANSSCRSHTRTTYMASGSTHQEMVTRCKSRKTSGATFLLYHITRYYSHVQEKQKSSETPANSRCCSQCNNYRASRKYIQGWTSYCHSTDKWQYLAKWRDLYYSAMHL